MFVVFGTPSYIHFDRDTTFIFQKLVNYLQKHGINANSIPYKLNFLTKVDFPSNVS